METSGFALITGAGSGIGREVAFTFAERGAAGICIADINTSSANETSLESKKYATNKEYRAIVVQVDIADQTSVHKLVQRTVEDFGRIDYAVNSAGISGRTMLPIGDTRLDEFQQIQNINSTGTFLFDGAVSKQMLLQEAREVQGRSGTREVGKGAIVNMASLAGFAAGPRMAPYAASKHAVMGLTKSAAVELTRKGVRVNAVCPGWTQTPMLEPVLAIPKMKENIERGSPLGRIATVEEIAGVVHFLCSDAASFVTGQGWIADSGASLTMHL